MHELISWFQQVLTVSIQLYFQQECEVSSLTEINIPSGKELNDITGMSENEITPDEKVVLMLALMPHLCPQILDIFFVNNKNFDRP